MEMMTHRVSKKPKAKLEHACCQVVFKRHYCNVTFSKSFISILFTLFKVAFFL